VFLSVSTKHYAIIYVFTVPRLKGLDSLELYQAVVLKP